MPANETNFQHQTLLLPSTRHTNDSTQPFPAFHSNTIPPNAKLFKQAKSEPPITTKPNPIVPATMTKPSTTMQTTKDKGQN